MAERFKRSLQASSKGIEKAKQALTYGALSQSALATELGVTRQTVSKFFRGQGIDRQYFVNICERLALEWDEIVAKPSSNPEPAATQESTSEIDILVQRVRRDIRASLHQRYGTVRVLDMSQPVKVSDIYTDVEVLEKISGRRRVNITDLVKLSNFAVCDRLTLRNFEEQISELEFEEKISGLEAVKRHSKLLVLGKPGLGKTMFLKYIAIQCISDRSKADQVPIFLTLKDFAEAENQPTLLDYSKQLFQEYGVEDTQVVETLLSQGRLIVLLDGLDEVKESDDSRVLKQISSFTERFYKNSFVMTCRTAAKEYGFEHFTEVEIADFSETKVVEFVSKWFQGKADYKVKTFIRNIQRSCQLRELAKKPLLLTLLCLVFEESDSFPLSRLELYREVLDVLLRRWDAKRNIKREQIDESLSSHHIEDLLSKIALTTFNQGHNFFKSRDIEQCIVKHIQNSSSLPSSSRSLKPNSETILKSIEAQYGLLVEQAKGIYSFSHLTFHEYFAAKEIVTYSDSKESPEILESLAQHVTDKRWHEVFLLTSEMLQSADSLVKLMKREIDESIAQDEYLQAFLTWVNQKSSAIATFHRPAVVRAFYFDLALTRAVDRVGGSFSLARTFDVNFTCSLDPKLSLDLALDRIFSCSHIPDKILSQALRRMVDRALDRARVVSPPLAQALQPFKEQLPTSTASVQAFKDWWENSGRTWVSYLKIITVEYRNIGHNWQFTDYQKEKLKHYYSANELLLNCLNSDCRVTPAVRQQIEATMLLPVQKSTKTFRTSQGVKKVPLASNLSKLPLHC